MSKKRVLMLMLCGIPGEDAYRAVRILGYHDGEEEDGELVRVQDLLTGENLVVHERWLEPLQDLETFRVIWQAVADRGYREGYTSSGFVARQVLKLVEELGELVEAVQWAIPHDVVEPLLTAAAHARGYFDTGWGAQFVRWPSEDAEEQALAEAEDLQVVLAVLFAELRHRGLAEAVRKAVLDVERGVRGE